jgi:hypothetical protein
VVGAKSLRRLPIKLLPEGPLPGESALRRTKAGGARAVAAVHEKRRRKRRLQYCGTAYAA